MAVESSSHHDQDKEDINRVLSELIQEGTVQVKSVSEDGSFCYSLTNQMNIQEDVLKTLQELIDEEVIDVSLVAEDGNFCYSLKRT
jgi:predicted transcriptional regulator